MLHRYAFSNFQSFKDRTEVSWLLDAKVPAGVWSEEVTTGERVSSVMAIVGPNASGKTGLLKPVAFLHWFLTQSFQLPPDAPLPFHPHPNSKETPSEFEIEVDFEGQLWRYTLRATHKRVLHEALYVKRQRMGYVFVRDWDAERQTYTVKQQDFGFNQAEALKVRANASFIATAAQYGVPLAKKIVQSQIWTNIHQGGRVLADGSQLVGAAQYFAQNTAHKDAMVRLLSHWDLGLSDVQIREFETVLADNTRQKLWIPFGIHKTSIGSQFELDFSQESSGTQGTFVLLSRLLPALQTGGLAIIDEFENDLHPHMLGPILDMFASKATNPHHAQLLFTCHAIEVLNILHKSQIMLVEKDDNNESNAWRLDSVEGIRHDDNFYAKYMAGAYGAIPQL
jgi:hypothetical protein